MSIAIAGYMVSTDPTFENIIVEPKHIDIACLLLESIYNNPVFKLKEFVDEERKRLDCSLADINAMKELIIRYPSTIAYLENNNNISKNTLHTISGLDITIFNELMKGLSKDHFITLTRDKIYPTPKFLMAIKKAKMT